MPAYNRKYPGKTSQEIFVEVDKMMEHFAQKHGLKYQKDAGAKTGKVSKMGVTGSYVAKEGEVAIDLHFPMLIPGSVKKTVTESIEKRLDGLFA